MPKALGACSLSYWNWEEDITIFPGFVPSGIGLPVENLIRGSIVLILCITLLHFCGTDTLKGDLKPRIRRSHYFYRLTF